MLFLGRETSYQTTNEAFTFRFFRKLLDGERSFLEMLPMPVLLDLGLDRSGWTGKVVVNVMTLLVFFVKGNSA